MSEEQDLALVAMPDSLLTVVVEAAHTVLRGLDAAEISVACRPLLRFDRRGLASSAARRQFVVALRREPVLRSLVAAHLMARPEVAAMIELFMATDSLTSVHDSAQRGDVELLVAALWAGSPTGADFALGLCASTEATRKMRDEHGVVAAGLEQRLRQAEVANDRAQLRAVEAEDALAQAVEALRDERAGRRSRDQTHAAEVAAAHRSAAALETTLAEQRATVTGLERRLAKAAGDLAAVDVALRASRDEYALLQQAVAAPAVSVDEVNQLAAQAASLEQRLAAIAQKVAAAPVAIAKASVQPGAIGAVPKPAVAPRPAAPTRRTRPNLPGGMIADTGEGIGAVLTRTADLVLIVDGYNVSQRAWPESPLSDQREKLARALHQIHVRYGCDVVCCFDGDGTEGVRPIRRAGLRIVFSARSQEADELVVDQVEVLPKRIPVVVVSSDAWVKEHAERAGALVISASTVLDVARQAGRR